ncbi:GDSL esterase/lipase At3g14820 [Linum grandiflorum]
MARHHFVLLYILLVLLVILVIAKMSNSNKNNNVPAVFVFGDSVVDTGNNNYIPTIGRCNFPPYGRDFPSQIPTGRFSNGRCVSDFLAEFFKVKQLLPPYLDPNLELPELLTGVCFASAGAGFDPRTSEEKRAVPLLGQLDMLREYISKANASVGERRTWSIISASVYITLIGSNDLNLFYPLIMAEIDENSFTDQVIRHVVDFYQYVKSNILTCENIKQQLYAVGARRIAVASVPPTGCTPAMRIISSGEERVCAEILNRRIRLFNSKLSLAVDRMNEQLPEARILLVDLYYSLLSVIQNPAQFGIEEVTRGCCGTGHIETGILCVIPGTCPDASKYLFWDSFHPTEDASRILTYHLLGPVLNKLL